MKKIMRIIVPLILVIGGGGFGYYSYSQSNNANNKIYLSGTVEVTETDLSFRIAGIIAVRNYDEGNTVKNGDIIAELDKAELQHNYNLVNAELYLAHAAVALAKAQAREEEIAQAEAAVEMAQAQVDELIVGAREEEIAQAEAGVAFAQAILDELNTGAREEEISQVEFSVAQAKAKLSDLIAGARKQEIAQAESILGRSEINADQLSKDLERMKNLLAKDSISKQQFEQLKTKYENAQKLVKEAQERLDLIIEGARPEHVVQAKAVVNQLEKQLELVKKGPREESIKRAEASLTQVKEKLKLINNGPREETKRIAKAALMQAEQRLKLVKKGQRQEIIDQAVAQLELVKEKLAYATTKLGFCTLKSPVSGEILSKNVEVGEYVFPGSSVVTIGNLEKVWVRAYISETELGKIKLKQEIVVKIDSFKDKEYVGHITFIASDAEFTPKTIYTKDERVKLVYRIKIEIENSEFELKPGMPVDVEISLSESPNSEG